MPPLEISVTALRLIACGIVLLGIVFLSVSVAFSEITPSEIAARAERAEATVWKGFRTIWDWRVKHDMADSVRDTLKTGMLGVEYTPLTTTLGNEEAKELSTKSGWASWLVKELIKKGVRPHDYVAVSMTGSFPALDLAVMAALQELDVNVKAISSVGSSSYGANELGLSWPEMERLLQEEGVLRVGCSAVTLGGTGDRGLEWDEETQALALVAVKRSGRPLLAPYNLRDAIKKRMFFYGDPRGYVCFINIGGGQATLGGGARLRFVRGGWFTEPLGSEGKPKGVMDRFLEAGVPCLNLLYLDDLNRRERILRQ